MQKNIIVGEELITDAEFDKLTEELERLNPNSEILKKTGWGSEEYGKKYDHKYQLIGSLSKTREWEGIPDKFKQEIILSQKLDGSSAVVQYKNGKIVRALTRGNGRQGLDITSKLKRILKSDRLRFSDFTGEVRGELIISQENWEKLRDNYPEMKNSRNAVAGIINRKDVEDDLLNYVDYVVYKVTGSENIEFESLTEIREWLKQNFENTVTSFTINSDVMNNKEMWDFQSNEFYNKVYPRYGYQIDGLVLSLNKIEKQENGAIIYDEYAYKFESTKAESFVTGIEWNLSRNQRLVPVVKIDPTEIDETTVSRVSGNNALYVKNLQVGIGAKVEFMKANEIIPIITEVIEPVETELPEVCPICGHKLDWDGVDLVCNNPECENLNLSDLIIWTDILGKIDNLAWITKNKYFEERNIHSVEDLHEFLKNLDDKQISEYTSITDKKMISMYDRLQYNEFDLNEILVALNIPRLGWMTANKIFEDKEAYEVIMRLSKEETISGTEIDPLLKVTGPATLDSILENSKKLQRIHLVKIKEKDWNSNNEEKEIKGTFCVTGKLEKMKRNDLVKFAEEKGWQFIGTVNKDCQYLVTNVPNSGSSKNKKAQELGTKLVTENEFYELLEK